MKDQDSIFHYTEEIRKTSRVAAGAMSLRSFIIRKDVPDQDTPNFYAAFYISSFISGKAVEIRFEDSKEGYLMKGEKVWGEGPKHINWDRTKVAASRSIGNVQLRGFARLKEKPNQDFLVPIRLTEKLEKGYFEWIFKSDQTTTLEFQIIDPKGKIIVGPLKFKNRPPETEIPITWDLNKDMIEGVYKLSIRYWLLDSGDPSKAWPADYKFYHKRF